MCVGTPQGPAPARYAPSVTSCAREGTLTRFLPITFHAETSETVSTARALTFCAPSASTACRSGHGSPSLRPALYSHLVVVHRGRDCLLLFTNTGSVGFPRTSGTSTTSIPTKGGRSGPGLTTCQKRVSVIEHSQLTPRLIEIDAPCHHDDPLTHAAAIPFILPRPSRPSHDLRSRLGPLRKTEHRTAPLHL